MKLFGLSSAILLGSSAFLVSSNALGQENTDAVADDGDERKIVVTGSRIKRTLSEEALPVTIISKIELQEQGITSAEQLMLQLNVAANSTDNLASNVGITNADNRGNNGFSGANLRHQGASSTLVLLNGRRVATHGMKGRAVDINSIPMAAVERVEVLRDGASAVYGTDAIGGVINFIMKENYQGAEISAYSDITEAGGGNINRVTFVGGIGDIHADGFNVLTTLSIKNNEILRGTDRDFTNTFQSNRGLSPDTRGPQFGSINDRFSNPNDPASSHYNLIGSGLIDPNTGQEAAVINILDLPGGLGCDIFPNQGPYDHELWNSASSEFACAWDYPRAAVLQQPVESINLVTRATYKLDDNHELFAEVVASEVTSDKVFEPVQITPWNFYGNWYPSTGSSYQMIVDALSSYFGAGQLNIGAPIAYRWRCMDCGPRQIETMTEASRFIIGAQGTIWGDWDYQVGISTASSEGQSHLKGGYYFTDELAAALGSGEINPFLLPGETQTQAGLDMLAAASATGTVLFSGKSTLFQVDASVSGDTGVELGGGNMMLAAGIDFREEEFEFQGDRRDPANQRAIYSAPFDQANILDKASRDITAVYAEVLLPFSDSFETTVAVRNDNYSGFGGTTNPKISVKYNPVDSLLLRGAYNTGFRVPSFNQLFDGVTTVPYTGLDMVDPATCPSGVVDANDPGCTNIEPNILYGGKEDLEPEESIQSSYGFVWAPTDEFSFNMDWWKIKKEGTIQLPGFRAMLDNYDVFRENFIRDNTGNIIAIDSRWVNAGERKTSGVEVGMLINGQLGDGMWDLNFNGSYLIEDRSRIQTNVEFSDNAVGKHTRRNIPLRWKHTLKFGYSEGDWRHTLTQIYRDSYLDEVPVGVAAGVANPPDWNPVVNSYTTHNYSLNYSGLENWNLTFGIRNLMDKNPPFTAHQNDYSPGAAFDPRIADPRGRAYTFLIGYKW
ncbi:MAG: TonB-dependent receptor [Gammaproteobacteria bacterium]|nr:TonB-dependent receptor [Gammaproteobacteria bacterium]